MPTTTIDNVILAVITIHPEKMAGGSPVFIADTEDELQKTSFALEKILDGIAHEVRPGTLIIVRH
jgi:hypothetical protein